jgi:hypothetical protein
VKCINLVYVFYFAKAQTSCFTQVTTILTAFIVFYYCLHRLTNSYRTWFRHPLRDMSLINERLDTVEFFLSPVNIEVASSLQNCLKNMKHLGVCSLLYIKLSVFMCTVLVTFSYIGHSTECLIILDVVPWGQLLPIALSLHLPVSRLSVLGRLPSLVHQSGTAYQLKSPGLTAYRSSDVILKTMYLHYRILA